jgi:hypothetical protein
MAFVKQRVVHNEKRIKNKKAISDEFSGRKVDPLIIAMMHTSAAVNELNTMNCAVSITDKEHDVH